LGPWGQRRAPFVTAWVQHRSAGNPRGGGDVTNSTGLATSDGLRVLIVGQRKLIICQIERLARKAAGGPGQASFSKAPGPDPPEGGRWAALEGGRRAGLVDFQNARPPPPLQTKQKKLRGGQGIPTPGKNLRLCVPGALTHGSPMSAPLLHFFELGKRRGGLWGRKKSRAGHEFIISSRGFPHAVKIARRGIWGAGLVMGIPTGGRVAMKTEVYYWRADRRCPRDVGRAGRGHGRG